MYNSGAVFILNLHIILFFFSCGLSSKSDLFWSAIPENLADRPRNYSFTCSEQVSHCHYFCEISENGVLRWKQPLFQLILSIQNKSSWKWLCNVLVDMKHLLHRQTIFQSDLAVIPTFIVLWHLFRTIEKIISDNFTGPLLKISELSL